MLAFAFANALCFAMGCNDSSTSGNTPAAGSGNGFTFATTDFFINVVPPANTIMTLHANGNWLTSCSVPQGTTGQDLTCILEAEELDLYANATVLQFNGPGTSCSYLSYTPYYYYLREPGLGPSTVSLTESNGNITGGSYSLDGSTNVTVSYSNGTPICSADYSKQAVSGPNCCQGSYTLGITNTVTTTTGGTTTTSSTTTYSNASWGGAVSNCLGGPAVQTQTTSPQTGFPKGTLYQLLPGQTVNQQYTINSPIAQGFYSNLFVSNYFTPGGGTHPYGLTNAPTAIQGPGSGIPSTSPWYELDCLDAAGDIVNRIRLLIRSWSVASNFTAQLEANSSAGGAEASPFDDHQLYNFEVWTGANGFVSSPAVPAKPYPNQAGNLQ